MVKARTDQGSARAKKRPTAAPKKGEGQETSPRPKEAEESQKQKKPKQQAVALNQVGQAAFASLAPEAPEDLAKKRNDLMRQYLQQLVEAHPVAKNYNIVILHDELRMVKGDADHIYSAARAFQDKKPLLLILHSTGGHVGPAYLIGKLCREYSSGKLIVVVPRRAKSAANLICCAADEIHMGSLSELGPIDPQVENLPALGLKSSIEHIADLVRQYPQAAEMFAKYLHYSIQPIHLGYYERVAESATQYAERLLKSHPGNLKANPSKIAKDLVYSYKDHGFVIDHEEATEIFGQKLVKKNTDEYNLGNAIYNAMDFFSTLADMVGHNFYFIGSLASDPHFLKRPQRGA